ncbi:conserved exported hypothetical protein [uncultured delta proteobacterium]|uniref:Uncharacterized protein n=1 Tax=uncultured delta proteobacterium TaxID=34034 RepID=A0A212J2Q1_9DELT|nr:conserved exported hypothetical protein [uncultured delta proteobacterium]
MHRVLTLFAAPFRPRHTVVATALVAAALLSAMLPGWPLHALEITRATPESRAGDSMVLRAPALLGRPVQAGIIHSVQLTPVIDEYRVQEGRLWTWQERIMSHNAGLPSLKPERGRFVYDPPWMIVEGTGESWETIVYRVGTGELGRNTLCVSPSPCRDLWREMPGARLVFSVVPARL